MNESIQLILNILAITLTIIAITGKLAKSLLRLLVMLALYLALTSSSLSLQDVAVADGPSGNVFTITTASNDHITPAVSYNANANEFLVAWVDRRNPGNNGDIYARRLASDGEGLGGDLAIAATPADQREPALTPRSGSPDYLVVWIDRRNFDDTDLDVFRNNFGAKRLRPTTDGWRSDAPS